MIKKSEVKNMWQDKSYSEIKNQIDFIQEQIDNSKERIKETGIVISELDINDKYYMRRLDDNVGTLKYHESNLKDCKIMLEVLNPIAEKKKVEEDNKTEYDNYCKDNKSNVDILLKSINELKQRFISKGSKIVINIKGKEVVIEFTEKQVDEMYENMTIELIQILKNRCGKITKVHHIQENSNRGFDCLVDGEKGTARTFTILAGGEIQKPHLRTLCYFN